MMYDICAFWIGIPTASLDHPRIYPLHCRHFLGIWNVQSSARLGRFHVVLHGHGEKPTEGVEPQTSFSGRITEAHPTWMGHGEIVNCYSSSGERPPEKVACKFILLSRQKWLHGDRNTELEYDFNNSFWPWDALQIQGCRTSCICRCWVSKT